MGRSDTAQPSFAMTSTSMAPILLQTKRNLSSGSTVEAVAVPRQHPTSISLSCTPPCSHTNVSSGNGYMEALPSPSGTVSSVLLVARQGAKDPVYVYNNGGGMFPSLLSLQVWVVVIALVALACCCMSCQRSIRRRSEEDEMRRELCQGLFAKGQVVTATVTFVSDTQNGTEILQGSKGTVLRVDPDGDVLVRFDGQRSPQWVRYQRASEVLKPAEKASSREPLREPTDS